MVSSGVPALDPLLGDGYPDESTVLVLGPSGVGKEALGYWFTQTGLAEGDFCLYVTRLSVKEVIQDEKGSQGAPLAKNQEDARNSPSARLLQLLFHEGWNGGQCLR